MACSNRWASKILLCLGVFLVASCQCMTLAKLKALAKLRGNVSLSRGQAKGSELHRGTLVIGPNPLQDAKLKGTKAAENLLDVDTDYQADTVWRQPKQSEGHDGGFSRPKLNDAAVEQIFKMEPKVECTGDSMKLQVQDTASTPGSLVFVDRGSHRSPLPLSKLPQSCGYTIRATQRDLVLVAPYDGCFVAFEEDSYVLPLLWLGIPVRMSCPLMRHSSPSPPVVSCHAEGMVMKMEWTVSVAKIKINLNSSWEPIMKASSRCGFSVVEHPEGVVISVRYSPCLEKKDGMYTLELAGDGETTISCPSLSPAQPEPTKSPAKGPNQQPETPSKPTEQPNGKEEQPVYPYPFYVKPPHPNRDAPAPKPELRPLPSTDPPVVKPNDRQQPFYPFLIHPQPPKPETPPTEPPLLKPPPGKLDEPSANQPEGQEHKPFYPFPFYPQPPASKAPQVEPPHPQFPENYEKELPEQPVPQKPPVSDELHQQIYQPFYSTPAPESKKPPQPEVPQGQVYQPWYPYPIYPQPEPQPTTKPPKQPENPQGQVYQPWYPYPHPQPESPPATKSPKPSQPEAPQGQVYQLWYPQPEPDNPTTTEPPKSSQPETPRGQVYQPWYPYPQPGPENTPTTKPPKPSQPKTTRGQVYQPWYPYPQPEPENTAATEPPKPSQPEAPQGQVYQPWYPYPQPEPENTPATEPPKPSQPEAPQGQVYQPWYPYPQPEPENTPAAEPPKPSQPEAPQGQVYQPWYPYPQPEPENTPATEPPKPSQPEAPQGQVYQPWYPYPQPEPVITPATEPPKPSQPEAPQGQVYQPWYPYPQPELENPLATEPPKLSQPETPQGQAYQPWYPYLNYPEPKPGNQLAEKLTAVPTSPATETSQGDVNKPYNQPSAGTNAGKTPTENTVLNNQPPAIKPPEGQVPHPYNRYFYPLQPQYTQPVTLPLATTTRPPQQVTTIASVQPPTESAIPQHSKSDKVPQDPQPGSSIPPVYCPQFCPSGLPNCCPQIAFHQHLHHIVPAGPGSKDAPHVYPGLPFLPSVYSGFGGGFGFTPLPQKPTTEEATTTPTSAPTSPQSLLSGNEKQPNLQPPDGNPALLGSNPSKPTNQQMYPYFVPNSQYPYFPYPPQHEALSKLLQRPVPVNYRLPSKSLAPGDEPEKPVVQNEMHMQQNKLSAGNMNNPSGPNFMSLFSQNLQLLHTAKQLDKPTARGLQPPGKDSTDSKGPTHLEVQRELDRHHVQSPPYNKVAVPSKLAQPQPFVSELRKPANHEQTVNVYSEPKSYVLLQHGPPGREPSAFNDSPLLINDQVYDLNLMPQNLAKQQGNLHQSPHNLRP